MTRSTIAGAVAGTLLVLGSADAARGQAVPGRGDVTSSAAPGGQPGTAATPSAADALPLRWVCVDGKAQLAEDPEDVLRFIPADSGLADWVQLNTGETLGGELLHMRDGTLEFDSDELGVVRFDWADVRAIHVSTPQTYVREDLVPIRGPAALGGNELVVCTDAGEVRVPVAELFGIIGGTGREIERWSFQASVGYSANFGTSRQDTLNGTLRLRREDYLSRLTLGYDVNYGRARDDDGNLEPTINNMWGSLGLDFFVSREFYITAAQGRVGYDEFQNLRLRATPGAGVGYRIFDGGPDWDVEIGGAYQYTEFREVQAGSDRTRSDGGLRLATFLSIDVTDDLTFGASHVATVLLTDVGQSNFLSKASVTYDLSDEVNVHASLYWDRLSDPTPPTAGPKPEKDTITVTAGLGVSL